VFKRFQQVLFGLFEFDPEMTLSVIDPMNLRYHDVIAAKKGICEPVANNLVTANWIAPKDHASSPPWTFLTTEPGQSSGLPVEKEIEKKMILI
jgi:hypothetical protein